MEMMKTNDITSMNWKLTKKKLSEVKPYDKNPRQMTKKGMEDLHKSIDKFGLAEPIVINTDGIIVGGHARFLVLKERGAKEFDCYIPDRELSEKEVQELNVRLNKNIAGEFDFDILANEFELNDLLEWGFEEKELDLSLWSDETDEQLDDAPEPQKEAISKTGDLFLLDGRHRVLCGDSTKIEDVEKLMDGKKADMVFTDPPYNVNYEGYTKDKLTIKSDAMADNKYADFLNAVFKNYRKFIKDGCGLYICHADAWQKLTEEILNLNGIIMRNQIIWAKNIFAWGMGRYKFQHEPIFYAHIKGKSDVWYGDRSATTLWQVNKPSKSESHPTMKPIELIVIAVNNSSKMQDIVLDLFLGSGSTLIACEQTNRICHGMEIDPIYIDVILKRYHNLYPDKTIECSNRKFDFGKLYA